MYFLSALPTASLTSFCHFRGNKSWAVLQGWMYVSPFACVIYMPLMTLRDFSVIFLKHRGSFGEDKAWALRPVATLQGWEKHIRGHTESGNISNMKRKPAESSNRGLQCRGEHQRLCVLRLCRGQSTSKASPRKRKTCDLFIWTQQSGVNTIK